MPVTLTGYVPAIAELHDRVAVPDVVMLLGVIAPHVRLVGTTSVRATVPVKPLSAAMVIVDVAEAPVDTAPGDVADIEKLGAAPTLNVTVAECDRLPLVPVTATVNVPVAELVHESVAVPDVPSTILATSRPQVGPVGDTA